MGALAVGAGRSISRDSESQPAADGNLYRYPPASGGNYFATHYHLGRRKFLTGVPEQFLFGELSDINLLNPNPVIYPYKPRGKSQPVKCLRSHIYVQRDSVRLVKADGDTNTYCIEFIYDSEVDCQFTVYRSLPDTTTLESLCSGSPPFGSSSSPCLRQPSGSEKPFKEKSYTFSPGQLNPNLLAYDPDNGQNTFPVCIFMETAGEDDNHQALLTICNLDRSGDGYSIKVLKQKLLVEGVEYLLQELYGLENKASDKTAEPADEGSDTGGESSDLGAECVVCITDVRDTLLLPCRHLCLCSTCAANLRYQSNNCPICRSPFQALLNIQALVPLKPDEVISEDDMTGNPYAHPGYRSMSLLQALNGYPSNSSAQVTVVPDNDEELAVPDETEAVVVSTQDGFPMETLSLSSPVIVPVEPLTDLPMVNIPMSRVQRPTTSAQYLAPSYSEDTLPLPGTPVSDSYPQQVVVVVLEEQSQAESGPENNNQVSTEGGDSCYSSQSSVNSDGSGHSRDALLSAKRAECGNSRESK